MALRLATAGLPVRAATALPRVAAAQSIRFQSSSSATPADPKSKANSLLNLLPGNSIVSKTGWVTLGTGLAGVAISKELFVVNEEVVILGTFALFVAYISSIVQEPYANWAAGQVEKIKKILNSARKEHTDAVQTRIDSVSDMKDVVDITNQLYALSKETAQLEHENFILKQKHDLAAEVKTTLDSWIRYEANARESAQKELVASIVDKVLADLKDPKVQKDILADAVAQVEGLVKSKAI